MLGTRKYTFFSVPIVSIKTLMDSYFLCNYINTHWVNTNYVEHLIRLIRIFRLHFQFGLTDYIAESGLMDYPVNTDFTRLKFEIFFIFHTIEAIELKENLPKVVINRNLYQTLIFIL